MITWKVEKITNKILELVKLIARRSKYQEVKSVSYLLLAMVMYEIEKEMATHSSILAWKIPWTEDLGRLQSMGSQSVGHDWATSLHFTSL